jgi:hypothetical protein
MFKLGQLKNDQWVEHSFAPVFRLATSTDRTPRIIAGIPKGDATILDRLLQCLEPPYYLLYILHTPRGEGEPGRYQSPQLSAEQVTAFLSRFQAYLSADARYDIWVHSPADQATIVWDRHNQLFAYGPIDRFANELRSLGFSEGEPEIPSPHEHNYRSDFDQDSRRVLQAFDWSFSPLHPEDQQ